jgi:hypothetical protein
MVTASWLQSLPPLWLAGGLGKYALSFQELLAILPQCKFGLIFSPKTDVKVTIFHLDDETTLS